MNKQEGVHSVVPAIRMLEQFQNDEGITASHFIQSFRDLNIECEILNKLQKR
ncbi:hypothetical protein [Bacillus sp. MUM 13]|uniref:hypothetical protein n=1 Tax=Bacillus sp. MUM 13 TaxID=1678001 RepID=UPI00147DE92D|nr:hypothetical protein [Bacillus sp. MUM 13]